MKNLTIIYDNWCPKCTRFVKVIKQLDWLNLIELKKLRNIEDMAEAKGLDVNLAGKQMASFSEKWQYGFNSLYNIFLRIPSFWIIIPIVYIMKLTRVGQFLYVQLALKRKIIPLHCSADICNITSN